MYDIKEAYTTDEMILNILYLREKQFVYSCRKMP